MRSSSNRWRRSRSNSSSGNDAFARQVGHQFEQSARKFRQPGDGNRAGVRARVRCRDPRPCGADLLRSGGWCAMRCRCEPPSPSFPRGRACSAPRWHCRCGKKAARKSSETCATLRQHHLHAVRKRANGALRPRDRALRAERGSIRHGSRWRNGVRVVSGHWRTFQMLPAGARAIARFCGTRYFCAAACACAGVTARNPSRIVFTRLRIAIEQREARQIMHQAEARHMRAHSAFEHRVIIGAKFHFHRIEFVFADRPCPARSRITSSNAAIVCSL